jgi:hypothetical protein
MNVKAKLSALLCVSGLFLLPQIASADTINGHIATLYVSTPTNLPFRVILDTPTTCQASFFYVDGSSPNYQVYVSALMLAYSQGKTVRLVYQVDANNWCEIREIGIS